MSRALMYPVPILFLLISLNIFFDDPSKPIGRGIPIVVGEYRLPASAFFMVISILSYIWIKRSQR